MASSSLLRETHVYHSDSTPIELDVASHSSSSNNTNPKRTLIFFHGGGLISGSRRSRFPPFPVDLLLQRGWLVIVPDYRLLPEADIADILNDLRCLEEWVLLEGQRLGIDLEGVAVSGSSAGSFVSVLALSSWTKLRPRGFLSLWSMVNTSDEWYQMKRSDSMVLGGMPASRLQEENFKELLRPGNPKVWDDRGEISDPRSRSSFFLWLLKEGNIGPIIRRSLKAATGTENLLDLVTSSFPPTIIVHGTADSIAPITDSHALMTALRNMDVKVRLIEVVGADHGISPQDKYRRYFEKSVDILEEFVSN